MHSNNMKKVKFVYESKQIILKFAESLPLDQFLIQVKNNFNLAPDVIISLYDIDNDIGLVPTGTGDLWHDETKEIPAYKIITRTGKGM